MRFHVETSHRPICYDNFTKHSTKNHRGFQTCSDLQQIACILHFYDITSVSYTTTATTQLIRSFFRLRQLMRTCNIGTF